MVNPSDDISLKNDHEIDIRFSETHYLFMLDFKEMSERMLLVYKFNIKYYK